MEETNPPLERREAQRISWSFIIKHRPQGDKDALWDTSFIKNLSLKGCYFFSSRPYKEGQILELQIRLPTLRESLSLSGEVKRCEFNKSRDVSLIYGIAVSFSEVNEEQKKVINETIAFFLNKQKPTA